MNSLSERLTGFAATFEQLLTHFSWSMAFPSGALEFAYPVLFALTPMPFLLTVFAQPFQSRFEAIHVPFFREVAEAARATPSSGAVVLRRGWLERGLSCLIWILLVAALARPQWVDPPVERIQPGRDLLLAVDISQSMDESDFPGDDGKHMQRLSAVKQVLDRFIATREGDRIGLVVFGDGAYVHVPFTLDHSLLREMLAGLQVGMAGARTRIGDAIGLAIKLFGVSDAKHKVMIVLSDGNDTGSKIPPDTAATIANRRGVTMHAVAIGDPATRGNEKVQLATLQDIARIGHGIFALGTDQRQLAGIYQRLDALEKQDFQTLSYRARPPLFQWPLGLAVLLLGFLHLVLMLNATWRRLRHE
jgi:Ca-activated chloride channel family protein